MAPLICTLVRHGESVDNLTALWAGHRDAPLTNHGASQAARLGAAFKDVPITAIYSSDLKRAHSTAKAIYDANTTTPKPPFIVSELLREQNFGAAEGAMGCREIQQLSLAVRNFSYGNDDLPVLTATFCRWEEHRAFQIADHAESLNNVAERADLALRHFLTPHLVASAQLPSGEDGHHVVLVAHGIFLAEMMFALKRGEDRDARFLKVGGYTNTGWSRVEIESLGRPLPQAAPLPSVGATPAAAAAFSESPYAHMPDAALRGHVDRLPTPLRPDESVPALRVKVVAVNQVAHLAGLERQKGGIGSAAHDEKQRKLQDFFGGASGGGGLAQWPGK